MTSFYGVELYSSAKVGVLPPILGGIEAWKAHDDGRPIVFVRPRPDIIAYHLGGSSYFSNVPQLEADLEEMQTRTAEPGELRLLELRRVENGRIPLGIFEPVSGWPLRNLIGFVRCEVPLAAAIALQIYRTYTGAPNVATTDGKMVREMLPHFSKVWRREAPSFIGNEPDISIRGRIAEARKILAAMGKHPTDASRDTDESGPAFEAEMLALAGGLDLGPALAQILPAYFRAGSPYG